MARLPTLRRKAPARPLTDRQRQVLSVIARYYRLTSEPPTATFVSRQLGISRQTTRTHLHRLADAGRIVSTSMLVPLPRRQPSSVARVLTI